MNPQDMAPEPRRRFVKKSIVAAIALSQPMFFAGLIRASGGGGESTTGKPDTTVPDTTEPHTTSEPPITTSAPDETTNDGETTLTTWV
jgi:hypothetical protein